MDPQKIGNRVKAYSGREVEESLSGTTSILTEL